MRQASIVADNILLEARGKAPKYTYENYWADGVIKLTLGLVRKLLLKRFHENSLMLFIGPVSHTFG